MSKKLIILAIAALLVIAGFIYFDLGRILSFEYLKESHDSMVSFYESNRLLTALAFFGIYVVATALSLPGATILTLAGGAVFGLGVGFVLVSFASTIGATLAFLLSRFMFQEAVASKFSTYYDRVNSGVEEDGAFYLFSMRLVPAIPFFVVNLMMGLTKIKTLTYALVSQLGMLPGTLVYVNAGSELSKLDSLKGILSPRLIAAFVLLGVFPVVAKKLLNHFKARRTHEV